MSSTAVRRYLELLREVIACSESLVEDRHRTAEMSAELDVLWGRLLRAEQEEIELLLAAENEDEVRFPDPSR